MTRHLQSEDDFKNVLQIWIKIISDLNLNLPRYKFNEKNKKSNFILSF